MKSFPIMLLSAVLLTPWTAAAQTKVIAIPAGSPGCSARLFASEDVSDKWCSKLSIDDAPEIATFRECAREGEACIFQGNEGGKTGEDAVIYGSRDADGLFSGFFKFVRSRATCSNATFGGDPKPGIAKICLTYRLPAKNESLSEAAQTRAWSQFTAQVSKRQAAEVAQTNARAKPQIRKGVLESADDGNSENVRLENKQGWVIRLRINGQEPTRGITAGLSVSTTGTANDTFTIEWLNVFSWKADGGGRLRDFSQGGNNYCIRYNGSGPERCN